MSEQSKMIKLFRTLACACFLLLFSLYTQPAIAATQVIQQPAYSLHHPVPGGIAVIELGASESAPQASFQNKPVLVVKGQENQWLAIVGIALTIPVGQQTITVTNKSRKQEIAFTVLDKKYK